ncbi:unnamed protein product [Acanthoscelides obtectus]|uniref:Uncharacterized protein n=1 Tax=Acanthoscelides obtectus TaxID=200917 RepID=A0A9P0MGU6_ACAOB|nr:unnamed protein product [Acanthoscelides obtectus]CAK1642427.1 hypothetical protein AOBTE_LOCUS13025 [Acanthoscelides obtectus]
MELQIFFSKDEFFNLPNNPQQKRFPLCTNYTAKRILVAVATSLDITPPRIVNVDHPFILLLQNREDGAANILFQGRVLQPVQVIVK